jgi:hypothetical protein
MDKKEIKLNKKTIQEMDDARERIKEGELYTEKEAKNIIRL